MKNRILAAIVAFAALCPATVTWAQTAEQKLPSQKTANKTERTAPAPQKSTGGIPSSWKQVPIPKLPDFTPKEPVRVQLNNGMVIFLQENHELPLVSGYARIRGGSTSEPASKVGLTDIYGEAWRTSGTAAMNGDKMDDYLEARAAKIETDGGSDSTSVSFDCLKQDFDDVFKLFTDLLRNPQFNDEKVKLAKDEMTAGIARRNDDSQGIAGREAGFLAYGKNNPYVRIPEYYTVSAITLDDLVNWHKQHVAPENILLGMVGDFDAKQMEATLRAAFDSWPKANAVKLPEVQFSPAKPGIYVADKPEVNQSEIRMVELGIERKNPDYFAVAVFNELFGGGFSSRLFSNLRTKQGLAYSVGGGIGAAYDHPGVTRLSMGTKTATTADAIKGMFEQIAELKTNPPSQAELNRAKDSVLNSFIFNIDTPSKVLQEQMTYEFYGYPKDFLERFKTEVEKVTLADVNRVAEKYLKRDQLAVVVVGNAAEIEKSLAGFGQVQKLDISIPSEAPGEKSAEAAKPAESNAEGKALMAKVVQALGGADAVNKVTAIRETLTLTQKTPMGEMQIPSDVLIVWPDKTAATLKTPQGEFRLVVTPDAAFMAMGPRSQALPDSQKKEHVADIQRDMLAVAQHVDDAAYSFSAAGTETVNGQQAVVLNIGFNGSTLKWDVDPQSGRVLRASYKGMTQQGPATIEQTYSDWKTFSGINAPTKTVVNANGQQQQSSDIQNIEINPTVDPKVFEKPAAQ